MTNPTAFVPVVPFANRPRRLGELAWLLGRLPLAWRQQQSLPELEEPTWSDFPSSEAVTRLAIRAGIRDGNW